MVILLLNCLALTSLTVALTLFILFLSSIERGQYQNSLLKVANGKLAMAAEKEIFLMQVQITRHSLLVDQYEKGNRQPIFKKVQLLGCIIIIVFHSLQFYLINFYL